MLIVHIKNDGTGDELAGNYDYKVYVNDQLISVGRVEGHRRSAGWRELVRQVTNWRRDKNEM